LNKIDRKSSNWKNALKTFQETSLPDAQKQRSSAYGFIKHFLKQSSLEFQYFDQLKDLKSKNQKGKETEVQQKGGEDEISQSIEEGIGRTSRNPNSSSF
jgi:hypothetical protein